MLFLLGEKWVRRVGALPLPDIPVCVFRKAGGNSGPRTQRGHLHSDAQPLLYGTHKAALKLVSGKCIVTVST